MAVSLNVFLSNFGYAGLILLLVLAVILLLNNFQKKVLNILGRLSSAYNDIETILVRVTNSVEQINSHLGRLDARLSEIEAALARSEREMIRLADGTSAQSQLSKAIEMAREGASASEIMLSTSLPQEEAEAIARFHKG